MDEKTSKETLLEALRAIIHEEVGEAIRQTGDKRFDLNFFKSLKSAYQAVVYAEERLEALGAGSSRMVFLLSSGKVLKIAHGKQNAGKAQNQEEVSVFTNPKSRPVVAKVFDYDPNFRWIISELVKPLENSDYVASRFGISGETLAEVLSNALDGVEDWKSEVKRSMYRDMVNPGYRIDSRWYNDLPVPRKNKSQMMSIIWNAKEDDNGKLILPPKVVKAMENELALREKEFASEWNKLEANVGRLDEFIGGVKEMQDTIGFSISDIIGRNEHLGVTSDDRLVILDYGYSKEVGRKFYNSFSSQSDEVRTGWSNDGWSDDSDNQSSQPSNSGRSGTSR